MCGICGVYQYGTGQPANASLLSAMMDGIIHRGPDDAGMYSDGNLGIGMRRLSIIDLAGGVQPMANEDESVWVVFNGEIYNYRELANDLRRQGHRLKSDSDTEVIVHLYEEFGENCVQSLRGMFAFALWDQRRRHLFIARDRLGIKPLYYAHPTGCLVFASEIKSVLQHPEVTVEPDLQALSRYLSLKYVPAPQTMFQGISVLPPGHTLTCGSSGVRIARYWNLSYGAGGVYRRAAEYAEELESLLKESVTMHLMSDVPFGAFLSGGVDSSTIVALMTQVLRRPVKTFSVGYEGPAARYCELPYARLAAREFHTDHLDVIVSPDDIIEHAEKVVWHLDQPIADAASLPMYLLSRAASREVKMVLVGEGSDELFAGYARYAGEKFAGLLELMPRTLRQLMLAGAAGLPGFERPKLALNALCQSDEIARIANWFPLFNEVAKSRLLSRSFQQQVDNPSVRDIVAEELRLSAAPDRLSRMLYFDTKLWLADDLLARGDKTTMAASLEARVPFLDHKLVEFAASLPSKLKLNGLSRKYLLKKVVRQWVPSPIISRKKKGFPVPLGLWFRHEARSFARDLLSPATLRRRGLFDPQYVDKLFSDNEAGRSDEGSAIWGLLNVELWYRQFIDQPIARRAADEGPLPRSFGRGAGLACSPALNAKIA